MVSSSNPPRPVSDDTARDIVTQVARLARAVESHNLREKAKAEREPVEPFRVPAIHYTDPNEPDTINPPRMPRNLSWHEKVREKKVSLPAATGWSVVGLAVAELLRMLLSGQMHF